MQLSAQQINQLKQYIHQLKPTVSGKLFYYCLPFRKKVVLQNLSRVFKDYLSADEIKILAQAFYSHVLKALKETILLRFLATAKLKANVEIKGEQYMWQLLDEKIKGAILITGHFGSWEFAPIAGMLHFPQFKGRFYFVRKFISFKWLEKILFARYSEAGLNVIPKKNSLQTVCDALEKNNAVIFVIDQHSSTNGREGVMTTFLGLSAGTYRSPAVIAKYMNVPVLPVRSYRKTNGIHVLEFFPKIPWITHENKQEEIKLNTQQYNDILTQFILEYPEQWMWMHKRWKV